MKTTTTAMQYYYQGRVPQFPSRSKKRKLLLLAFHPERLSEFDAEKSLKGVITLYFFAVGKKGDLLDRIKAESQFLSIPSFALES